MNRFRLCLQITSTLLILSYTVRMAILLVYMYYMTLCTYKEAVICTTCTAAPQPPYMYKLRLHYVYTSQVPHWARMAAGPAPTLVRGGVVAPLNRPKCMTIAGDRFRREL